MLIVADVNAPWRSRPFEALSKFQPVLGLEPMDALIAVKKRRFPIGSTTAQRQGLKVLSAVLAFGWATTNAKKALPRLWSLAEKECRRNGAEPSGLVVTSPHYASLIKELSVDLPTYYYCSDDYSQYTGWDAPVMRQQESEILHHVRHAFFVSAALREGAINGLGATPARVSVSMNATDEEFLRSVATAELDKLMKPWPELKRPIVGVIGSINDRLDFDLITEVANVDSIGSILLVGGIDSSCRDPKLATLRRHAKCVFVGHQPHASLPGWLQLLDVALIPFRHCHFNAMCSPMRLFDHLAAGRPIVSTDASPQIKSFGAVVAVARTVSECVDMVVRNCDARRSADPSALREIARQHTWHARAEQMSSILGIP